MLWIAVWTATLAAICVKTAHHMRRHAQPCSNCGKLTALATGLTRPTGRLGEAVAVVADAAAPGERECSCNACGHTFWTAT